MSDTPRTDKAIFAHYDEMFDEEFEYVEPQFARNLEREADKLAKQCVRNVEEIGQLRAQLESETKRRLGAEAGLKSWKEDEGADAKRLDWLLYTPTGLQFLDNCGCRISRAEIDAVMEAQNDDV
jgi:hypothetical protein